MRKNKNELKSLSEYVFVDGEFDKTVNGDTLILVETFSKKPFKVLFRVNVPSAQIPVFQNHSGLRLKVFGSVISPLESIRKSKSRVRQTKGILARRVTIAGLKEPIQILR